MLPLKEKFDPKKHLSFTPPSKVYSMTDLALPSDTGVGPVAVSEPFQLFTPEAIQSMRAEMFQPAVLENCHYRSKLAQGGQLRGYAVEHAPFIYDTWTNSETLAIVSAVAGIDLVPQMDLEIGHVNLCVKTHKRMNDEEELAAAGKKIQNADQASASSSEETPIVAWHTDSYPFVCVVMMSDCTNMIGGETALRTGRDGEIMKVRGLQMGCAIVLQGRYIEHQALHAFGTTERITMVTSFRPRDPTVRDDTVLTTVRAVSDRSELYFQFCAYRLQMLQERIRIQLERMRPTDEEFDVKAMKQFLHDQEKFLAHMQGEMIEEEEEKQILQM